MSSEYRICKKTVMDTIADPDISFDEIGVCNYVKEHAEKVRLRVPAEDLAERLVREKVDIIKKEGRGKEYDSIVGVSGGVDSTYTAYISRKFGLRPLAVHVDNGWNSELAVGNIEKVLRKLDIDLVTKVLDWDEFKDIQLSFLKASVPDGEIPTDHAIYAVLYKTAAEFNIRYILMGSNMRTEGIMPKSWASGHLDWKYIRGVHKKFGRERLKTFPKITLKDLAYYIFLRGIKKFAILDYVPYSKKEAMSVLLNELGWLDYGGKHFESVYTRFFQGYILPEKFNIDKRKCHLSNLIISGDITRKEALEELKKPPYGDEKMLKEDMKFVIKKFGLTEDDFDSIMNLKTLSIYDYPNNIDLIRRLNRSWNILTGLKKEKR